VEVFCQGKKSTLPPVASIAGGACHRLATEKDWNGYDVDYANCEFKVLTDEGLQVALEKPRVLVPGHLSQTGTHWHAECDKVMVDNRANILEKRAQTIADIVQNGSIVAKGCVDLKDAFAFNEPNGAQWYSGPEPKKMVVTTFAASKYDVRANANPHRNHPQFMHVFAGTVLAIALPPEDLVVHLDLVKWLKCSSTSLAGKPYFVLQTGFSLWVPYGWCVILTAIPSDTIQEDDDTPKKKAEKR